MNIYLVISVGTAASMILVLLILDRRRVLQRVAALETQAKNVVPFWRGVQEKLISDLTHPHQAAERVDQLLKLLKENPQLEMSEEDRAELLEGLARRAAGADPEIGAEERRKAQLFPLIMEEVQKEAANPNPMTQVQLVGIKEEKK